MAKIRDMIFVNCLEKRLGRRLNEEQLSGEEFEIRALDGHYELVAVPLVDFPYGLLPDYALNMSGVEDGIRQAGFREVKWNAEGKDPDEIEEDI